MKINERTILKKGCRICEQEYLSLFPALAVSYYSNRKGLKAELGSDRLLGVPLETYIPSEKLAIESGSADENIEIMKYEELSVIAMMSSFCTVMNLMYYFLILAVTRLDIHLQQECVKLE